MGMDDATMVWGQWAADVPRLLVMAAVLFLPGSLGARLAGMRGPLAVAVGPLLAACTAAIGAVACGALGLRWDARTFAASLLIAIGACALCGRATRTDRSAPSSGAYRWSAPLIGALALGWAAIAFPFMAQAAPGTPIQGHDTVFHMNALWRILVDGNASGFGGLTRMFGLDTTSTVFPAGWHALVAPFASRTTIVPVVNSFSALVPLIWLTGLAALAAAILPGTPALPALTVALAPLVAEFPTYMLTKYPAWPNALGMALVPALAALGLTGQRAVRLLPAGSPGRRRSLATWAGALVVQVLGICLIHPLAGLSLGLLGAGPAVVAIGRRWGRLARSGRSLRLWGEAVGALGTAAVLAVLAVAVPFLHERLARMLSAFQTVPNVDWYNPFKALSLWSIVDFEAPDRVWQGLLVAAVSVSVLTVAGAVEALRTRAGRLLVTAWAVASALTLTSLMRSGPLLGLAGIWYLSTHRTMAVQVVAQLPLMALGALAITSAAARVLSPSSARHRGQPGRPRRSLPTGAGASIRNVPLTMGLVPALLIPLAGGLVTAPQRADLTWRMYSTDSPFSTIALTDQTMALARRASELIPEDALVLGDPFNGSAYVQVLGDREVVFPQLYFRESNTDLEYLRLHFNEISTNPRVCSILRSDGIGYAWIDSDPWHEGADQSAVSPGLYDVDLRDGFEVLGQAETVSLVRITACG
ncbi:MAG: hypothetical protein LKI58_07910 [Actinomyces sp.]|nr:DUF6541 family protein [Actinomyces sp.]MCI1787975.1 hypothetical protein [Actinomyces sp.]MCI1830524.1 hypothetical protein [Actinomyces sp.]